MGVKKVRKNKRKVKKKPRQTTKKKACKKAINLKTVIKAATFKWPKSKSARTVIGTALKKAREAVKKAGGKAKISTPRILPVSSRMGGALPF